MQKRNTEGLTSKLIEEPYPRITMQLDILFRQSRRKKTVGSLKTKLSYTARILQLYHQSQVRMRSLVPTLKKSTIAKA
jgi:hypothetical protein